MATSSSHFTRHSSYYSLGADTCSEHGGLTVQTEHTSSSEHDGSNHHHQPCHASSASCSALPSAAPIEYEDYITVFQAAPLAYLDNEDKKLHSMGVIDFDQERDVLTKTFNQARIAVSFEVATTDRLGAFLARGEGRVLHFSTHGHPEYLAIENGWGALQCLEVERLKDWITHGGRSLEFVFVSACHSRSIGQAFVDAGVPHVVCCRQDKYLLRETTAVEFENSFYRALAHGKVLSEAFQLARQEILASPRIQPQDRQEEAKKFCLLPKNTNHDVPIFFTSTSSLSLAGTATTASLSASATLPRRPTFVLPNKRPKLSLCSPPPQGFSGRELEMYKILQALRNSRLVRVHGPPGIGKSCLVRACCRYIGDRLDILGIQEIIWLPIDHDDYFLSSHHEGLATWLEALWAFIHDDSTLRQFQDECRSTIKKLINYFMGKRAIIVIEAKERLSCTDGYAKILFFLERILHKTQHIKIILIHRVGEIHEITTRRMPCVESDIPVPSLSLESTVKLFGRMCQHVTDRIYEGVQNHKDLLRLLVPRPTMNNRNHMSRRLNTIFTELGEGVPAKITKAAKQMTRSEYQRLIEIGRQKEIHLKFESRAALIKKQDELSAEIAAAARDHEFQLAHELQGMYDEIESLEKDFPDLNTLKKRYDDVNKEIEHAVRAKDWLKARDLEVDLSKLRIAIQVEKDAHIAYGIMETQDEHEEIFKTRTCIDAKVEELELELQGACNMNDFKRAREIDSELHQVENLKRLRPTKDELERTVNELDTRLSDAKNRRDWDEAELIFEQLKEVQDKLDLEIEAEETLGLSRSLVIVPPSEDDGGTNNNNNNNGDDDNNNNNNSTALELLDNQSVSSRGSSVSAFSSIGSEKTRTTPREENNARPGAVAVPGTSATGGSSSSLAGVSLPCVAEEEDGNSNNSNHNRNDGNDGGNADCGGAAISIDISSEEKEIAFQTALAESAAAAAATTTTTATTTVAATATAEDAADNTIESLPVAKPVMTDIYKEKRAIAAAAATSKTTSNERESHSLMLKQHLRRKKERTWLMIRREVLMQEIRKVGDTKAAATATAAAASSVPTTSASAAIDRIPELIKVQPKEITIPALDVFGDDMITVLDDDQTIVSNDFSMNDFDGYNDEDEQNHQVIAQIPSMQEGEEQRQQAQQQRHDPHNISIADLSAGSAMVGTEQRKPPAVSQPSDVSSVNPGQTTQQQSTDAGSESGGSRRGRRYMNNDAGSESGGSRAGSRAGSRRGGGRRRHGNNTELRRGRRPSIGSIGPYSSVSQLTSTSATDTSAIVPPAFATAVAPPVSPIRHHQHQQQQQRMSRLFQSADAAYQANNAPLENAEVELDAHSIAQSTVAYSVEERSQIEQIIHETIMNMSVQAQSVQVESAAVAPSPDADDGRSQGSASTSNNSSSNRRALFRRLPSQVFNNLNRTLRYRKLNRTIQNKKQSLKSDNSDPQNKPPPPRPW